MSGAALLCALALAGACRSRPGPADAGGPIDAGATPPPTLQLGIEAVVSDGGVVAQSLEPEVAPFLPVTQALVITANLPLHNYRLRVLDELDRALASDDVPVETTTGLRYRVALLAPLRSGHRYTVLLDAQSGATLDDGRGTPIAEQRFEFRTEGERERDTPSKFKAKRRHRRTDGP